MKMLRLALIAAATAMTMTAAMAQTAQPPQSEQSGYTCSSKARAPATS
ncbi:MAG: hypothetical protein ACRC56_11150 [Bosea sp. (in: a-proteobacteria)]